MGLKPKKYHWKKDKTPGKKKYGLIAQDVAQTLVDCGCEEYAGLTQHPAVI
jgi:hypothetical protein